MQKRKTIFVGIDEVGRGPLAGPVAVCAFVVFDGRYPEGLKGIRDSKKISEQKREEWRTKIFELKKEGVCDFAVRFRSPKMIDEYNINNAISQALQSALKALKLTPKDVCVLLDGGLRAPKEFIYQETIIKGDAKESVISAAAIVAKTTRDRLMTRMAKKYPEYGFEVHKGYGTKKHYEALRRHGISEVHRLSFLKHGF